MVVDGPGGLISNADDSSALRGYRGLSSVGEKTREKRGAESGNVAEAGQCQRGTGILPVAMNGEEIASAEFNATDKMCVPPFQIGCLLVGRG
jgi:hypothetical protein